jgi:hypothetical protein
VKVKSFVLAAQAENCATKAALDAGICNFHLPGIVAHAEVLSWNGEHQLAEARSIV